jgi:hypothetical protein
MGDASGESSLQSNAHSKPSRPYSPARGMSPDALRGTSSGRSPERPNAKRGRGRSPNALRVTSSGRSPEHSNALRGRGRSLERPLMSRAQTTATPVTIIKNYPNHRERRNSTPVSFDVDLALLPSIAAPIATTSPKSRGEEVSAYNIVVTCS